MRRTLIAVVAAAGLAYGALVVGATGGVIVRDGAGCPRSIGSLGAVSWADVVRVAGTTYERTYHGAADAGATVDPSLVGERLGTVRCAVGDAVQRPSYDLRDLEATFLHRGTALHAITDTDTSFRIVALEDGAPIAYESRPPADATRGHEVVRVGTDRVRGVAFLSAEDGRAVLGRLRPGEEVTAFVDELGDADVDREAPRSLPEAPRVFIALELEDQPPTVFVAYPDQAFTNEGPLLSERVLARLPTPAPTDDGR